MADGRHLHGQGIGQGRATLLMGESPQRAAHLPSEVIKGHQGVNRDHQGVIRGGEGTPQHAASPPASSDGNQRNFEGSRTPKQVRSGSHLAEAFAKALKELAEAVGDVEVRAVAGDGAHARRLLGAHALGHLRVLGTARTLGCGSWSWRGGCGSGLWKRAVEAGCGSGLWKRLVERWLWKGRCGAGIPPADHAW